MAGGKGKRKKFEPLQIRGIDTRVWQKEGSSSDIKGALFTVRGEVAKAPGIKPVYDVHTVTGGVNVFRPGMKSAGPGNASTPFNGPIYALGAFQNHGITDLIAQFNDSGGLFSHLVVIRPTNSGAVTIDPFVGGQLNGLSPARGPGDSYRFVQS